MLQSVGQADGSEPAFPFTTVALLGGTGSLGTALTHYLLGHYPYVKIRVYSRGEHRQATLRAHFPDEPRLSMLIGDVRDYQRLQLALQGCDLVIHAAALKRIDTAEYNPYETVATNVVGTWNVLRAAMDMGVRHVVTISSDKACKPETLYGASKQVAERLAIQGNHYASTPTRSSVVRYGNVSQSQGSVIPLWQASAAAGEPLPVTHAAMTRFWLSLADAVRLVCFIAAQQSRGGLFLPHLPAFDVLDLARAILKKPQNARLIEGRDIVMIGLRGAEKIHEDLATDQEMARAYWYAPEAHVPCLYLIPPAVQHWETPQIGTQWLPPPAPYMTGAVGDLQHGDAPAVVPYNSATWPWRLGVEDLRAQLEGTLHHD